MLPVYNSYENLWKPILAFCSMLRIRWVYTFCIALIISNFKGRWRKINYGIKSSSPFLKPQLWLQITDQIGTNLISMLHLQRTISSNFMALKNSQKLDIRGMSFCWDHPLTNCLLTHTSSTENIWWGIYKSFNCNISIW